MQDRIEKMPEKAAHGHDLIDHIRKSAKDIAGLSSEGKKCK